MKLSRWMLRALLLTGALFQAAAPTCDTTTFRTDFTKLISIAYLLGTAT